MKENIKYIIIAVAVIVVAFILKPERSAFNDCYYENKKAEIAANKSSSIEDNADASREAIDNCRD